MGIDIEPLSQSYFTLGGSLGCSANLTEKEGQCPAALQWNAGGTLNYSLRRDDVSLNAGFAETKLNTSSFQLLPGTLTTIQETAESAEPPTTDFKTYRSASFAFNWTHRFSSAGALSSSFGIANPSLKTYPPQPSSPEETNASTTTPSASLSPSHASQTFSASPGKDQYWINSASLSWAPADSRLKTISAGLAWAPATLPAFKNSSMTEARTAISAGADIAITDINVLQLGCAAVAPHQIQEVDRPSQFDGRGCSATLNFSLPSTPTFSPALKANYAFWKSPIEAIPNEESLSHGASITASAAHDRYRYHLATSLTAYGAVAQRYPTEDDIHLIGSPLLGLQANAGISLNQLPWDPHYPWLDSLLHSLNLSIFFDHRRNAELVETSNAVARWHPVNTVIANLSGNLTWKPFDRSRFATPPVDDEEVKDKSDKEIKDKSKEK